MDINPQKHKITMYCKLFYNAQMMVEDIHTLSYETVLNEFTTDPKSNDCFKRSIANIPAIRQKAKWAARHINDQESEFPIHLIVFAILEGIFFSGVFCSIFWIEQKDLLRGLVQYSKFISRAERLHYNFAFYLFRKFRDDPDVKFNVSNETIVAMVEQVVNIETEFINKSIPCAMIGMNANLRTQYIKFVADHLLLNIQMEPLFKVSNPFDFMIALGLQNRANYFECRESIYSRVIDSGVGYDSNNSGF